MRPARARRPRALAAERRTRHEHPTELVASAMREAGAPLQAAVREPMEARFGHDLRSVRIHTGPRAEAAADALGAHALTVGDDVLFAAGSYAPQTVEGRMLLAHELAHVLQGRLGEHGEIALDGPAAEPPASSPAADELPADAAWEADERGPGDDAAGEAPGVEQPATEHGARDAAARALAGAPIDQAALAAQPPAHVARFVRDLPLQASIALLADPFVEVVALDFARALERDAERPPADLRRRLARLPDATRGAVVDRVQELLPEAQRERAAKALTGAVLEPEEAPAAEAEPAPAAGAEQAPETSEEGAQQAPGEPRRQADLEPGPEPAQPDDGEPAGARDPRAEGEQPGEAQAAAGASGAAAIAEVAPAAGAESPTDGQGVAEPAVPGGEAATAGAAAGEATTEAAAASPAAEAGAGAGGAEPDLGPLLELEARVERDGAAREESAAAAEREADAAAGPPPGPAPGSGGAASESGEPAAGADTPSVEPAEAAGDGAAPDEQGDPEPAEAGGEDAEAPDDAGAMSADPGATTAAASGEASGEASAPAESADEGPEAADTEEDTEPAAEPGDEPPPSAEEQALAAEPEPTEPSGEPEPVLPAGEPAAGPDEVGAAPAPGEAAAPAELATVPEGPLLEDEMAAVPAAPDAGGLGELDAGGAAESEPAAGGEALAPEPAVGGEPGEEAAAGAASTGDCGPDVGGGGGGGAAVEAEPQPEPPDVSGAEPAEAMGAVATLAPVEMGRALGGVSSAADRDVDDGRSELASSPPSLERPAGSPQTRPAGAAAAVAAAAARVRAAAAGVVRAVNGGAPSASPTPEPLPPSPPVPTQSAAPPAVRGGESGQLTAADAQAISASVEQLPVTDPGLDITAGPPPTVALDGDASPERAAEQRAQLDAGAQAARDEGSADAAAPLGEDDVYPTVAPETLTATPAGAAGAEIAAPPAPEADEPTAIIAREQQSEPVQAAAARAQSQMASERTSHDTRVDEGRTQASADMDEAVRASAEEQQARRDEARSEVQTQRSEWSTEQETAATAAATEADTEQAHGSEAVERERADADAEAAGHVERGDSAAATARTNAERDARAERDQGRQESRGVLGWLADQARGFFDRLRQGIRAIFDAARTLVRNAIQAATDLAFSVIDAARRRIVDAIRAVGDLLIAIGDRLLAAFPALRERFRAAIRAVVDRAVAAVNALADALKAAVQAALNALGSLIEGYINLLESAYMAAVEFVAAAVQRAISAAQAVVQALGQFAALVVDVAASPGTWLSNLGASVVDGIRNHLWNAIKCAVKNWFNGKIEELLGMARMIWNLLRSGGIRFAEVGRMLWEAIKASLPGMLIQLAIEKLVSLIVPAASALMLIIDGLRAAWGSISRIVAAFETFFRFLRAVRGGNAGPQFAQAVAAGAVALIEFLANFLLLRLRGPAQGVGGRLRALAAQIGARLRRVGQAIGRTVRRVVGAVRRGGRAAAGAVRGAVRQVGRAVVQAGRRGVAAVAAVVRRAPGAGAAVSAARRAWQRARQAWRSARARVRRWREQRRRRADERRRRRREAAERRLRAAVAAIRPQLDQLLARGVSRVRLSARLLSWQVRYLLRSLRVAAGGQVIARINPDAPVTRVRDLSAEEIGRRLEPILATAEQRFLTQTAEQRTRDMRQRVSDAEQRLRAGRWALPHLPRVEQVILLRKIRNNEFPNIPDWTRIRFGSRGGVILLVNPRRASQYQVDFPGGRHSYRRLTPALRGWARTYELRESDLLLVIGSRNRAILEAGIARLRASIAREGDRRRFSSQVAPIIRSTALLHQGVETTRFAGLVPVHAIAASIGGSVEEILGPGGRFAPLSPEQAASAVERDVRAARGETLPAATAAQQSAERARRQRIANIFRRLRQVVRRGFLRTKPGTEASALRQLAAAFGQWLEAQTTRFTDAERETRAGELINRVIRFLEGYHGGGAR